MGAINAPHLLVFQMCSVSGSVMPRLSACSSRKSKKYLTASGGRSAGMLRMAWKRSSKNFWRVPCGRQRKEDAAQEEVGESGRRGPAGGGGSSPWWTAGGSGRSRAEPSCGGCACATSWSPSARREAAPAEPEAARSLQIKAFRAEPHAGALFTALTTPTAPPSLPAEMSRWEHFSVP